MFPRSDDLPGIANASSGWMARAAFAAAVGLIVDGTFVAEAAGVTTIAGWVRLGVVLVYLITRIPRRGRSFLGDSLRVGIAAIITGIAVEALWPQYRLGALHIVFISGFSFIVLTVAIRVVFGHSGNAHLFRKRLPFFVTVGFLIFFAMVSRYVADLAPKARTIHLMAAAVFWLVAALIWMVKVVPNVTIPDPDT